MEHEAALRAALSEHGDLELRFQGGRSFPVHSLKLKLASPVLKDVITSVLDVQIAPAAAAAKKRKISEGDSAVAGQQEMPAVQVGRTVPCINIGILGIPVAWVRARRMLVRAFIPSNPINLGIIPCNQHTVPVANFSDAHRKLG